MKKKQLSTPFQKYTNNIKVEILNKQYENHKATTQVMPGKQSGTTKRPVIVTLLRTLQDDSQASK